MAPVQSKRDALFQAADDMQQALAAVDMLREEYAKERPKGLRIAALWTALAVCYARPFVGDSRSLRVASCERAPTVAAMVNRHEYVLAVRHKVYAHTDTEYAPAGSGLWSARGGTVTYTQFSWFGPELLDDIVALAKHQEDRFLEMAGRAEP